MKSQAVARDLVSFLVGVVFAIGLAISGMTQPQKVIAFLDPWNWDPSLLFVMLGGLAVHVVTYPLITRRASPLLDAKWHVPTRKDVTPRLVIGSAIFGVGWGLGGFCPGPGVTSLVSGEIRPILFVVAMLVGMLVFRKVEPLLKLKE